MCGIAGVCAREPQLGPATEAVIQRMLGKIVHRGPDGGGTQVSPHVAFGHRRLAIIDLHERSKQPMLSRDEKLWVTFNGEIYNFQELRAQLVACGHKFATESDTEVLLHGYREWGESLVSRLRGMFAFALWDERRHVLLMARDRFGKKPIFYHYDGKRLLFGSEIKSMLEWPDCPRRANLQAIHDYLTFGYCVGEDSAFGDLRKLLPGHYLVWQLDGEPRTVRYWELPEESEDLPSASQDELARELVERFDDAVRARLIADVPIGAFLSGGVDSSAVVARMAPLMSERLKTFSVGFAKEGYDETEWAHQVAARYGTEHYSFTMDHSLVGELPKLVWHYGEPYADSSALVTYGLARHVRKHVTVAVTGDGGDEILIGYSRYFRYADLLGQHRAGRRIATSLQEIGVAGSAPRERDLYTRFVNQFSHRHKIAAYGDALMPYLLLESADCLGSELHEGMDLARAASGAARTDVATYLPDDLLVKMDIASMASSLEARSPFLDHEFAEWACRLPAQARVWDGEGKALLKKAFEPHLPRDLLYRKKMGFRVPVKHWIRHEIRDFLVAQLTARAFRQRELVRADYVDHMIEAHLSGREDHGTRLWVLLTLELWFQTFIDSTANAPLEVDLGRGTRAA